MSSGIPPSAPSRFVPPSVESRFVLGWSDAEIVAETGRGATAVSIWRRRWRDHGGYIPERDR